MEFLESEKQLVALVGYDADGKRTVVSICMPDEIKRSSGVIFESWPATEVICRFALNLSAKEQAQYTRDTLAQM